MTGRDAATAAGHGRKRQIRLYVRAAGAVLLLAGWGCGGGESAPVTEVPPAADAAPPVVATEPLPAPLTVPTRAASIAVSTEAPPQAADYTTEVERVFATLTSPSVTPEEWEVSQARLTELGAASARVLAKELRSENALRREMAAAVLAGLGLEAAAAESALLAALRDESPFVRANAATALCVLPGHEPEVIPVLAALLSSDDPQLRQMATTNLGNFGPEAAPFVPQLSAVLDAGAEDVVVPVVELLGRIGPAAEEAAPRLRQIAFEQQGVAKSAATAALEQITPAARE
jgi:HEAT repeat protein